MLFRSIRQQPQAAVKHPRAPKLCSARNWGRGCFRAAAGVSRNRVGSQGAGLTRVRQHAEADEAVNADARRWSVIFEPLKISEAGAAINLRKEKDGFHTSSFQTIFTSPGLAVVSPEEQRLIYYQLCELAKKLDRLWIAAEASWDVQ